MILTLLLRLLAIWPRLVNSFAHISLILKTSCILELPFIYISLHFICSTPTPRPLRISMKHSLRTNILDDLYSSFQFWLSLIQIYTSSYLHLLIKFPSSLRNSPLNFWEAQRVVLTCCVVKMQGDTDPSGVPSMKNLLYRLCREKNTFPPTWCYTWASNSDYLCPLTQNF